VRSHGGVVVVGRRRPASSLLRFAATSTLSIGKDGGDPERFFSFVFVILVLA